MHTDPESALDTIYCTKEFAKKDSTWVVAAHDFSVDQNIEPRAKEIQGLSKIKGWQENKWKKPLCERS